MQTRVIASMWFRSREPCCWSAWVSRHLFDVVARRESRTFECRALAWHYVFNEFASENSPESYEVSTKERTDAFQIECRSLGNCICRRVHGPGRDVGRDRAADALRRQRWIRAAVGALR